MKFRSIALVAAAVLAVLVWAQDDTDTDSGASIHKPLHMPTEVTPYEPERIIRMTLHDYVGSRKGVLKDETTGRYVT
ncbi:MAG TPA: hypothetical protein VMY41_01545 [Thermohalobaculum sp.]|nr:hypothetical protein [Thermohalobaculum sp.]